MVLKSDWGRQIGQTGAHRFDGEADARQFMAAKIVHDDDVAVLQSWRKDLAHRGLESLAIDRTVSHERRRWPISLLVQLHEGQL